MLREFAVHYHHERNHQGLANELIEGPAVRSTSGVLRRSERRPTASFPVWDITGRVGFELTVARRARVEGSWTPRLLTSRMQSVVALPAGTRVGVYEIAALIGEGGMGQVYRATDTNLKRQVAIKILPASVAADAERLARFQREAEVLASLNHPHIAAIYGLENANGVTALVMELVEARPRGVDRARSDFNRRRIVDRETDR